MNSNIDEIWIALDNKLTKYTSDVSIYSPKNHSNIKKTFEINKYHKTDSQKLMYSELANDKTDEEHLKTQIKFENVERPFETENIGSIDCSKSKVINVLLTLGETKERCELTSIEDVDSFHSMLTEKISPYKEN